MTYNRHTTIVITGPTATGKSALAVEIAKLFNGEIISADSRQVYRGLDIGSAKITPSEMDGIPHHLIDVANPTEIFTVAEFQTLAHEKIADIRSRGKLPIICGGTGMYISAVINDTTFPAIPPDFALRETLESLTTDELYEKLKVLDLLRSETIDRHNRVRLTRAIEIITNSKHSSLVPSTDAARLSSQENAIIIALNLPKEILQNKIRARIESRIPALFDEIKKLLSQRISADRLRKFGLEYRYGMDYVEGKINLDDFKAILATKTWQFVRRQITWWKRDQRVIWVDMSQPNAVTKIIDIVKSAC